ncbi:hypothetical protein PWT90_10086 [Aphanocladium album]|nr:hypothetical protein PWT90_10086 [Aphanocladium album]
MPSMSSLRIDVLHAFEDWSSPQHFAQYWAVCNARRVCRTGVDANAAKRAYHNPGWQVGLALVIVQNRKFLLHWYPETQAIQARERELIKSGNTPPVSPPCAAKTTQRAALAKPYGHAVTALSYLFKPGIIELSAIAAAGESAWLKASADVAAK